MQESPRLWWVLLLLLAIVGQGGCAVQYYDPATQTDHLWGVGHFKMRVVPANEGVQATVKGATVVGASVKIAPDDTHLAVGWDQTSQMAVVSEGASVRLEWPTSDPFSVRVGSKPPILPDSGETGSRQPLTREGGH